MGRPSNSAWTTDLGQGSPPLRCAKTTPLFCKACVYARTVSVYSLVTSKRDPVSCAIHPARIELATFSVLG